MVRLLNPRRISYVCLLWLGYVGSIAASFTKRIPSSAYDTIIRLNRSRIQQWQHKCRQRQIGRSHRTKTTKLFSRRARTSGTRIFWGRPTENSISKRFWEASAPKFNNPHAGELTNPVVSAARSVSVVDCKDNAVCAFALDSGKDESWWPPVPFLSFAGTPRKVFSKTSPLRKGCEAVLRQVSCQVLSRRVLRYRIQVGEGMHCYERVKDFALRWEFDSGDKGIKCIQPKPQRMNELKPSRSVHPLEGITGSADRNEGWGRRMVSWTKIGPFHVFSPIAVIYECVNQRGSGRDGACALYTSCAYTTQTGHWLSGEERVTVALRDVDDPLRPSPVEVEIVSISRAGPSLMGRLAWPLIGRMQDKFFVEQLRALHRVAVEPSSCDSSDGQFACIVRPSGLSFG